MSEAEGSTGPRVFLSYGHSDAIELGTRLQRDLAVSGYDVWIDREAIRAGFGWTDEIRDGIRGSQVLVALLSPHAVRRASGEDGEHAADSVCLDEIEYAVDACRIPVVPVMAVTCEPPFRIFRLQHVDMRAWNESDTRYTELRLALERAIDDAVASNRGPAREWGRLPEPWDFGAFLADRRRGFVGREWLFDEIEAWRRSPASPALLVVGEPGVGKSAIVAQLVHRNPDGQVLAYHCCQDDTPATVDPGRFVRSLAAQIGSRIEGYRAALDDPAVRDQLVEAAAEADPASAFEAAILAPLARLDASNDGVRYLLLDALDEALGRPAGTTIVDLLATRMQRFPPWLRLVATTRPEPRVLRRLRGLTATVLHADDPRNARDVRRYVEQRLGEPPLRRAIGRAQAVEDRLIESSAGNFLVVATSLHAIERGLVSIDELAALPPGLDSRYETYFDRLYASTGVEYEPSRRVLEVVVAAQRPPSRDQIAELLGVDGEDELPATLAHLAAFLRPREGRYVLFHKSLADWLTGWQPGDDQPVAGPYHVQVRRGHERWADHFLSLFRGDDRTAAIVQSLPTHLAGARRWDDLGHVLTDPRFIEAKVAGPGSTVVDLQDDAGLALAGMPARHPARPPIAALKDAIVRQGQNLHRVDLSPMAQLRLQAKLDRSADLERMLPAPGDEPSGRIRLAWSTFEPDPAHRRTWSPGEDWVHALSITADGALATCGDGSGDLIVLDLDTGEIAHRIKAAQNELRDCLISRDGGRAVTVDEQEETLQVWDVRSGDPVRQLRLRQSYWGLALSADGRFLVTCNHARPLLSLWDLDEGTLHRELDDERHAVASCCAIAGEPARILSAHGGSLLLWDAETATVVDSLVVGEDWWIECDLDPTGPLAVAGGFGAIVVWDAGQGTSWTAPGETAGGEPAYGLAAGAKRAVWGSGDGRLVVWDLDPASRPQRLYGNTENDIYTVAVSADGRRALSATKGGHTIEWDLERVEPGYGPKGHGHWIWRCAVSADGTRVATLSHTRLMVWDQPSGLPALDQRLDTHHDRELRLSADGSRLCLADGRAPRYWDVNAGTELPAPDKRCPRPPPARRHPWARVGLEPPEGLQSVEHVALAGDELVIVRDDGTVVVWDRRAERQVAALCLGEPTCASSTPDGRLVVVCNGAGDVFAVTTACAPSPRATPVPPHTPGLGSRGRW
jgi:WD40 repeat protein